MLLKNTKYAKELRELGFSNGLYCSSEDCEKYLNYCKENNMIWFNDSYGTIVHKDFGRYFFEVSLNDEEEYNLFKEYQKGLSEHKTLDHVNFLINKHNDDNVYILTSSPYFVANTDNFTNYKYHVYVIHPQLLTYHAFIAKEDDKALENPLCNVSYAFTNASDDEMAFINKILYEDLGIFMAFVKIK